MIEINQFPLWAVHLTLILITEILSIFLLFAIGKITKTVIYKTEPIDKDAINIPYWLSATTHVTHWVPGKIWTNINIISPAILFFLFLSSANLLSSVIDTDIRTNFEKKIIEITGLSSNANDKDVSRSVARQQDELRYLEKMTIICEDESGARLMSIDGKFCSNKTREMRYSRYQLHHG